MRKFLSLLLALVMVLCCIPAMAETADGVYEGTGAGLNGQIKVSVTVSGGKITEVKVLEHSETAGISDPAIEKIPAAIVEAQSADVDIVSGATFTSKGIIEAVKNALNPDEAKEATMPFEQPDILVIGAGMAGLATAARAAELGLNVLVVDQAATYGGSANVAGGTLLGAGTRMQKEAGIEDDPDLCFADFVRLGGAGTFNEEIAREFSQISGEAVDWLDDLGTDFGDRVPYFGVYQPLNVARNYSGKGGARAFVVSLYAELEKYFSTNAYMMLNTYVTGLVTNDEGAVIGAKARLADGTETTLLAPATVVCTGGYGGSEELLNKYNFENVLSTSPACVTGDGYAWLEELGAPLTNMDFCTAYAGGIPTSDDFRSFGYFNATNGALWINTNGERMANETGADSHVKSETWANAPHNIVYTVFSSEMLIPDAKVFSTGAWGSVKEEFDPYVESLIEKGLAWKADTIEELAEKVGLPVDAFKATIAAYNDGCANGNDPFGRTKQEVAMANGPFYAVKTVPYVMITCGGPMMTKDCEVLNSDGLVIEGVYMAGEIVGMANVGGRNSIGGMGHGNCLVWGKKAAEVIAAKLGK